MSDTDEATRDEVQQWREAHARVVGLTTGLSPDRASTPVPACPDWSVKDLLAHVVGVAADVVGGDEPDDHNEAWTQAQVDARRDADVADLLAEWAGSAERLVAWMGEHGTRPLNDVVIHEQDLRGALGEAGARDTTGLRTIRDRMAARFSTAAEALPPLLMVEYRDDDVEPWHHVTRGSENDAAVVLSADGFELFRALTSRRTAEQVRAMTVRGDVTPYLDALAGLGPLPDRPLPE